MVKDEGVFFNWFILCLGCQFTWVGTVEAGINVLKLKCLRCGECRSFSSAIPDRLRIASTVPTIKIVKTGEG